MLFFLGDARRALEIAKRASEILETSEKPGTKAVDEAFKELFTSPKIDTIRFASSFLCFWFDDSCRIIQSNIFIWFVFLRDCSTLEKCILEHIVAELTRTGSEEASFASIERSVIDTSTYEGLFITPIETVGLCRLFPFRIT